MSLGKMHSSRTPARLKSEILRSVGRKDLKDSGSIAWPSATTFSVPFRF